MLDAWRHDRAPAGVSGRVSDGLALVRGGIGEPRILRASARRNCSQPPVIIRRFRGSVGVTASENIEMVTVAAMRGSSRARRTMMSEAIECPSSATRPSTKGSAKTASVTRPISRSSNWVVPSIAREVARHRRRVSAMALEIERDRDIAGPGERQRIGFHQLARPREAVGDNNRRRLVDIHAPVDGRRRRADLERRDRHTGSRLFQSPDAGAAKYQTDEKGEQAWTQGAQSSLDRIGRTNRLRGGENADGDRAGHHAEHEQRHAEIRCTRGRPRPAPARTAAS